MNAPSEREPLRLVETEPLTEAEVNEPLDLAELIDATFGKPPAAYTDRDRLRAFRGRR